MPKCKDSISNEQLEALEVVQRINNEQYDKVGWENHKNLLGVTICSYYMIITLYINDYNIEIPIHNSNNDDKYSLEDWYSYIKRKTKEIQKAIYNIKL